MFSLKHSVRRHAMMIAAVAATVGFAAASQADIYWDSSVAGNVFDNGTANFRNSDLDLVPATLNDDVVFSGPGGEISVASGNIVHKLTINSDSGTSLLLQR